jgi:hypothetical protein
VVKSYEAGNWDLVEQGSRQLGLCGTLVAQAYLESLRWANQILHV